MEIVNLLEKALNIRAFYHRVLSANIANVETPGYKEKDIDFRAELDKFVSGTDAIQVKERTNGDGISSVDGNTVNIESQIVKLTENNLMFNSLVQLVNKKLSMIRYAINEGRR